ncbi:MAG: multicopper oxidase domain-containing protein [Nitrosomonadaceae bacterium]|nr:multicopper oxidase domain-containing protein [Nitrosomonadaceae bacterium]
MNFRHRNRAFILIFLVIGIFSSFQVQASVREYWIAAEKVSWNYAPSARNQIDPDAGLGVWGESLKYTKYRYIGYTDNSYAVPLSQDKWMGILGPQIRGVVGDTIVVHFLNRTDRKLSMHPHGVLYSKDNEGADSNSKGANVLPGESYEYTWIVDEDAGPGPNDPSTIVWLYHSHVMGEEEINLGLVGAIIITRKGMEISYSNPSPRDVDHEFISLFMIFNEENDEESGLKHAINGRIFGNLNGYETKIGERVRWHVAALGNEQDNHTVHWHGQTVLNQGHRTDVIEVLPASMVSVDMTPRSPGSWLLHCHVNDHMLAGMSTRWHVLP